MNWEIRFLPEAEDDLASLNQSVRPEVLKGIRKVAQNPGYPDGYGKPLGNFAGSKLAGLYKIKFKKAGLRVVYALQRVEGKMVVIIISARADDFVYYEAENGERSTICEDRSLQIRLCSKNSVNATSVTKSEISRFRSRRPLPPDPYCSAPTQPPPLAAAWPWQVIGKNAKLNRRRDTFVSEISEFRHRRRD